MAAKILKCGVNRVWIHPDYIEDVAEKITREDIRDAIDAGLIQAKQKRGISRGNIRKAQIQKKKGRRKGHGSRKGGKKARNPKKERWIRTIRPIRERLRELRDERRIDRRTYREFYRKSKGAMFKSKTHLEQHLRSQGLLKGESE
ncbi:MAG: 50S ribosomal protein L19e [Thermoplasmata archaeon]